MAQTSQAKAQTMQAVALDKFGGPEALKIQNLPIPQIEAREVLIRVEAAGVGAWDPFEREGRFVEIMGSKPKFPYVLGTDGAGTIAAVGKDVNRFKDPHTYSPAAFGGGGTNGAPITGLGFAALSGLAGSPGGVPLYKSGELVGGIGAAVTGKPPIPELYDIQTDARQQSDVDEDVALAGQIGFGPPNSIIGSALLIDGIRLPYVNGNSSLDAVLALGTTGSVVAPYGITNSPPVSYPLTNLDGIVGELRSPIIGDPISNSIDGVARLAASEVAEILTLAAKRASITRAAIRLPAGQPAQVFIWS